MTEEYRFRKTNAEKINDVLYDIWDPIGVNTCAPRDEYESYVPEIQAALEEGATQYAIFCQLKEIESRSMALQGCVGRTFDAAKALANLYLPQGVAFDS